jgi:hypothetical protein
MSIHAANAGEIAPLFLNKNLARPCPRHSGATRRPVEVARLLEARLLSLSMDSGPLPAARRWNTAFL